MTDLDDMEAKARAAARSDSVARMRNIDALPTDWRALAHEFGYGVFYAWMRGWSFDDVRIKSRDGAFSIKAHGLTVNGHGFVPRAAARVLADRSGEKGEPVRPLPSGEP